MSSQKLSPPPPKPERSFSENAACALHEVSNALTVVLGWLDLGLKADSEGELRRALEVAREHARRGHVLARRAIGAPADSSRGGRSAESIAAFAAMSLRPTALERCVSVEADAGPGTDAFVSDEASLLQVLTNLLLNAIQFSPPESTVRLSVDREGDEFRFSVQDEGPGVPAEHRARLFDAGLSTRSGGAGIGLSHSRDLARERGGEVSLVPSVGGARFDVLWPVARSTAVRSSVRVSAPEALVGAHILVVEDDVAVATLIEMSCSARGAEVSIAQDEDALLALLAERPRIDAVLLDLSPVEDRLLEVLDEIAEVCPGAPLLLTSGQPTGIPAGSEGRFASWIRKPFDMEQLVQSIADLLESRSS